jgi:tetratricopeptide (TPR) repeat protein/CHAT domain-containing protein
MILQNDQNHSVGVPSRYTNRTEISIFGGLRYFQIASGVLGMKSAILDFQIRQIANDQYSVEAFLRGDSQPLATTAFDYRLSSLTDYGIDRLDFDPKDPQSRVERLREFGSQLYRKLFSPEIQKVWQAQKDSNDFLTLCLRIAPEARGLEALPWETLHDGGAFLAVSEKTGLSRLPLDIEPLDDLPPIPPPLKMLSFTSLPLELREYGRLQIEREQELLLQAINHPASQGKVQVDFEDEAKLRILESSMESGYHLFHFSGHGISPKDGGSLLLEDDDDKPRPTSVDEILKSLEKGFSTLRLAVISGCQTARASPITNFSDLARGLAAHRIPAVVAMQFKISDDSGLKLAERLYSKLLNGDSIEIAISQTRRQLWESGDPHIQADALAMVLFTSNGNCLQTADADAVSPPADRQHDKGFHLGTLPQLGFGFYGRRREYRQLRDDLFVRNQRAVIIHGIGGIGKTALVSHAAERMKKRFKGVYAFDCSAGALPPERIIYELHEYFQRQGVNDLQSVAHQPLPPEVLAETLATLLNEWPLLLIFDNFETQLERAEENFCITSANLRAFLSKLIKATATASRFLFTSRYLFDLHDDGMGSIQSLPLHDLSRPEAIMLMLKLPKLAPTHIEIKKEFHRTFGGHPYALVLLDRYCQTQSVSRALQDAAALHGKLREFLAIELIYARLSERTRELLNRFAAFRQAVSLRAAQWVMGEKVPYDEGDLQKLDRDEIPEEWKSLDDVALIEMLTRHLPERRQSTNLDQPLQELIDWGLLTPIHQDDRPKFLTMHALVRKFCRDQQQSEIWRARLRDAASFYTNQTKLLEQDDKPQAAIWGEMEAFALLMEAGDFIDAAELLVRADKLLTRWGFGRYLESQYCRLLDKLDGREAAVILHNIGVLFENRGNYDEALDHHQRSLKIVEDLGDMAEIARSLHQIGNLHYLRGNYDAALDHYQRSLRILEELDDVGAAAKSLHQIGMLYQARGNYDAALNHYERSLKILEELGDVAAVASSLHQIGMLHKDRGNYDAALDYYQRSLKIAEELGDVAGVASSLHQIGMLHQERGNHDAAIDHYQRSLKNLEELSDIAGVARSLHQIGNLHYLHGSYDAALEHYHRSLKIKEELGDKVGVASSLHQIGMLHQDRGNHDVAMDHYHRSLKIAEDLGDVASVALSLHQVGTLHQERGDYDAALDHYQRSLKIAEELGDVAGVARSLHQIGNLYHLRDNFDSALDHYQRSLKIDEELGDMTGVAISLHQIGMLHQDRGDYDAALDYYQRSLKIAEELGDVDGIASSLHQIGTLHQDRGDHDAAIDYYQRSLKIAEELSDVAGIAGSQGQIGKLMAEIGQYQRALPMLFSALSIFSSLQSPNAEIVADVLRELRSEWGEQEFDAAWQRETGLPVPEWLK